MVIWVAGPPASGKSTIARRMRDYGFTTADCENVEGISSKSDRASSHGTSSFVIAACYAKYLGSVPTNVIPVLLLPKEDVNAKRFQQRDPEDTQDLPYFYKLAMEVSANDSVVTIRQRTEECVDRTIFCMCKTFPRELQRCAGHVNSSIC